MAISHAITVRRTRRNWSDAFCVNMMFNPQGNLKKISPSYKLFVSLCRDVSTESVVSCLEIRRTSNIFFCRLYFKRTGYWLDERSFHITWFSLATRLPSPTQTWICLTAALSACAQDILIFDRSERRAFIAHFIMFMETGGNRCSWFNQKIVG